MAYKIGTLPSSFKLDQVHFMCLSSTTPTWLFCESDHQPSSKPTIFIDWNGSPKSSPVETKVIPLLWSNTWCRKDISSSAGVLDQRCGEFVEHLYCIDQHPGVLPLECSQIENAKWHKHTCILIERNDGIREFQTICYHRVAGAGRCLCIGATSWQCRAHTWSEYTTWPIHQPHCWWLSSGSTLRISFDSQSPPMGANTAPAFFVSQRIDCVLLFEERCHVKLVCWLAAVSCTQFGRCSSNVNPLECDQHTLEPVSLCLLLIVSVRLKFWDVEREFNFRAG